MISNDGSLNDLISFVSSIELTKPTLYDMQYHFNVCPLQSFIREVASIGADGENKEMECSGTKLMPHIRHLNTDLSNKTTVAMLMSAVCFKASQQYQPVMEIAETIKKKPGHMKNIDKELPSLGETDRLTVGGETLELADLGTLDDGKWLNDKIINSFLAVLKMDQNSSESTSHVFVFPSYTAVQWDQGRLDHWMFKKVQFSMYKHVLMPICVHGNHWVLMVADIKEKRIAVLDSMHGQVAHRWIRLWTQFMADRDRRPEISEKFGLWNSATLSSSKQMDSSSCGVFVLMNAECVVKGVPVEVMRQVHCRNYRQYVKSRLLLAGTTNPESTCDMPSCEIQKGTHIWVQCCVCGRWFHTKCCGIPTKAAIEDEYECCFCQAMYR